MENKPALKLSIVICTFNRAESLAKCLEGLAKQSFLAFEVIIVDANSTDNTSQIISRYSEPLKIKTIIFEEKELAKARDIGWRNSRGELVAWIDDDVVVSPDWAKEIVEVFEKNPEMSHPSGASGTGGVSGPTIIPEEFLKNRDVFLFYGKNGAKGLLGKIWNNFFLEGKMFEVGKIFKSGAWSPGSNFPSALKIKGLKKVDYLEACNMTIKRSLLEKVNGFDLGYKGVAEWSEIDLAMRIKELGNSLVFSSKIMVNHYPSLSGVFPRRTMAKERMENFLKFYFRHIFKLKADYLFKFSCYVLFLNFYWLYKAISTKNPDWLSGITGLFKLVKKDENQRQ